MKNLLHKLGVSATVGIATCLVASAPASATSAWEAAKQVDNQATAAGAVGSYIGLADGGNGLSTAFFEQTVGGNLGYYAIRRGASDSAWGAPAAISTPSTASGTSPITAAADAGGNALGLSVQNQGGVGGIFASPWLASASAPGAYGLIMSSSPAQGGLSDPAVAFDSSGRGYAVAGAGQGNANGDEPILLSVYTPSGGWSTAAPIAQNSSATSCTTKQICGQEPRLAVSPDGTVVIAYLSAMPSPIPGGPSTYQLNAVRAPVGAAAGSGGANSFTAPQPISSNPVPISQGPGGNGTPEVNFDVTIDASDTATIVDAESQSGVNNAVFATQWAGSDSKPGKPTQISGSQSFPPEPPAADPRVVSSGSRDVTAAWTESGPNPQASTIIAAELPPGAKGWSPPTGVSASTQGPGGGADAPATNVPPFALAEDSAATALLTWTNGGSVMWSGREVSGGWTTPGSISGASGAVNGTLSLSAGPLNQGDAMWVQSSNGRNAVFASRFSGLSSLPPTVSGVSPNSGTGLGNTVVRITGSGFTGATAVNFGNFPGQSVSVDSDTQITVTTPPGQPGTVDVTVTTPNGTSATSPADHYTYQQAPPGSPTVTGVNPSSGPAAGGTTVKIAGTNFSNAQQVMFGSQAATKFTVDYDNQITAVAPAGSGTVDVTVTTLAGTSATSSADHFTYVSSAPGVPTVSGVSPNSGPAKGGTSVTVKGTNLSGATAVHFGPNAAASFNVDSGTQITATSPAGSGTVDVTVTTGKGTSAVSGADQFTYTSLAGAPPNATTEPATVTGTHTAVLVAQVNPNGLATNVHFEYGLDSRYATTGSSAIVYNDRTAIQSVGGDSSSHRVTATVSGLLPNAVYHVRVVAANSAGRVDGDDLTFTTRRDRSPGRPVLGRRVNLAPGTGVVFVRGLSSAAASAAAASGTGRGFVPLTEARQLPVGTVVDARFGSVRIVSAAGRRGTHAGTFSGAIFRISQSGRTRQHGLTVLRLVENAFKGAPSFAVCHGGSSTQTIQRLHGVAGGKFSLNGRHASAATVTSSSWSITERCDGTLTTVQSGGVNVSDFKRHKTRFLRSSQHYLAKP